MKPEQFSGPVGECFVLRGQALAEFSEALVSLSPALAKGGTFAYIGFPPRSHAVYFRISFRRCLAVFTVGLYAQGIFSSSSNVFFTNNIINMFSSSSKRHTFFER